MDLVLFFGGLLFALFVLKQRAAFQLSFSLVNIS
jgi:hypothetical protein